MISAKTAPIPQAHVGPVIPCRVILTRRDVTAASCTDKTVAPATDDYSPALAGVSRRPGSWHGRVSLMSGGARLVFRNGAMVLGLALWMSSVVVLSSDRQSASDPSELVPLDARRMCLGRRGGARVCVRWKAPRCLGRRVQGRHIWAGASGEEGATPQGSKASTSTPLHPAFLGDAEMISIPRGSTESSLPEPGP